ncbi:MAG: alpha/beta hydrolase [Alphaproteobacteria bacterium]|nr:alpha/beta hydrolase [Alphaproteobacteria bacterium]
MHFDEHRIATADGPKVYARDYPHASAHRLPVICLHGLTRNSADFEAVAPRIAELGRRVIAIDARGRGKSENDPEPARYRSDVYVGDVLRVMDTLNVPRAAFLGTSMGGIMTMIAATAAPTRVAAAILNDIGPVVDPKGIARIASYVGKSEPVDSWYDMTAAVRAVGDSAFPGRDDEFWATFTRRVAREREDGRIEFAYDPLIAQGFAGAGQAPSLMPLFQALAAVPVLVVRGETSDILSRDGVEAMRAVKPDLEVAEVPDIGHAPTLEEPEAWDAIAAFLSKVE